MECFALFAQLSTNWLTKTGARYMITAGK